MRNYLALLISLVFLTACGGGSSSMPPPVPFGSVSGTAFDGLILNGTVSVYDFTNGVKGALLGQATTDSSSGLYSLSLQVESRPVLVEITGGYYVEEAGSNAQIALGTAPNSKHKLTALANYITGTALKVAATTYTHLAAGLAAYNISHGTAVATAINEANQRVSNLAGINIITTTPRQITDVGNASATLTPELRYGFLAGAISMWTYNHAPSAAAAHLPPYTSIDFAQLLYQDISVDGLLDGIGLDSAGAAAPLSFGMTPLGVDVYRMGIGVGLVQMAGNVNNKTGIDGAKILPFAQAYATNTDAMFNNIVPISTIAPVVTIISPAANAWVGKNISVTANVASVVGLSKVELLVDNEVITTATNLTTPTFSFDTTLSTEGAHTFGIRATDIGGLVTTANVVIKLDATAPSAVASGGSFAFFYPDTNNPDRGGAVPTYGAPIAIVVSDIGSGVVAVKNLTEGINGTQISTQSWAVATVNTSSLLSYRIQVKDFSSNCSIYKFAYTATGYWYEYDGGFWNNHIAQVGSWILESNNHCE